MDGSSSDGFTTLEVDGVPVHHLGSAEPVCTATSIFGVGRRDESLPTQGVLHAVEHVVMAAAKDTAARWTGAADRTFRCWPTGTGSVISARWPWTGRVQTA